MKALGRHILAEVYGCDPTVLNDVKHVENTMVKAALVAGAEVREVAFHRFSPQGVSGVVIISESHLAIHTWPELGYAAVDVFTCGDDVDPWIACQHICTELKAEGVSATETKRGILHPWGPLKGAAGGMQPNKAAAGAAERVQAEPVAARERPAPVGVTG